MKLGISRTDHSNQIKLSNYFDRLHADMIEAQCCLESGQILRASELIEKILRHTRKMEKTANISGNLTIKA